MNIHVNGEMRGVRAEVTVAELIRELGAEPRRVAVVVNGEVVPATAREARRLGEGDAVELLTFAGGG